VFSFRNSVNADGLTNICIIVSPFPQEPCSLDGVAKDWSTEQAKVVGLEIKRLRGGHSGQWLSDRTHELGYRVARTTISELENGKRKYISVAELVVLAQALDTAPVVLLYPPPYDEEVEYAPGVMMPRFDAAQAFSGIYDTERDEVSAAYWLNTSRLRADREVRDRRNSARNMLEFATRLGDADLAAQAAKKLAEIEGLAADGR